MSIILDGIPNSLIGGSMIGLSAGLLYLFNGKIAGISGIFSDALFSKPQVWRFLFIIGLILSAIFARFLGLDLPINSGSGHSGSGHSGSGVITLIIAGLLVGYGTAQSNGCTSGHGICGISRLSIRSVVAVLVFMIFAIITVFIKHHILKAA